MSLPIFTSSNHILSLLQTQWATQLDPIISNPSIQSNILKNISLSSSSNNVINHLLGRKLVGWRVIRKRSASTDIHDLQDTNPYPALSLILVTASSVVVDIEVF